MMTDTTAQDPAAIEREIRQTQDNMSRAVDKIGNQLSIKNVFNALLDKADENNVDARMLLDGARRNPIALGLIAAGAIWLVSDKDSKIPSLPAMPGSGAGKTADTAGADIHHRDYVSHMASVEQRPDEDAFGYQRRRDLARSNFFMVERDHGEEDSSFKRRLDDVTDKFRQKRHDWVDSASGAGRSGTRTAQAAAGKAQAAAATAATKAQDLFTGNPLAGGILAAAIGAAFGSTLPITRQEQDKLGTLGGKARGLIDENKEAVTSQLREKKDALLEKADAALQPQPAGQPSSGDSQQPYVPVTAST